MIAATAKECQGECGEQARSAGGLGDRPLMVLTAGKQTVRSPEDEEDRESWIRLQSQLVQLSTRGRQVVAQNSDHMIPYEAPEGDKRCCTRGYRTGPQLVAFMVLWRYGSKKDDLFLAGGLG